MSEEELKQMLYAYPHITQGVVELNRELSDILKMKGENSYIASSRMDGMPGSPNVGDPLLDHVIYLDERYRRSVDSKVNEINRLLDIKESVEKILRWLWLNDSSERKSEYELIQLRYFDREGWVAISMKLNFDEKWIYKVHSRIIEKILKWWHT